MSNNSSNLIFGTKTNLVLAATPSTGSFLLAYDSVTGYLSQKDDQGIISRIGVAPTASGILETFDSDILVSLLSTKSFGRYINGDIIPALGKTSVEVIIDALREEIPPTLSLNSSTTILFNQTDIENLLTYTYSINTLGATVSSTLLEWRRNNSGSWATLSTDTNLFSFTHSLTDSNFNTQPFNYKYTVTDSQGATNTALKNITPGTYSVPVVTFNILAATLSSIESNLKREKGNIESNISGLVTRNSGLVELVQYQLQYQKNSTGPWVNIGATVSISGATAAISLTNHNDVINLSNATSIRYRLEIQDEFQVTTSLNTQVRLLNIIFYESNGLTASNSGEVRALSNKIFIDGINPFILNTGTYSNFNIAMPSPLIITDVFDLDSIAVNLTNLYSLNTFNVLDFIGSNVSYNVFTMKNAVPYSSSHRHQITRT